MSLKEKRWLKATWILAFVSILIAAATCERSVAQVQPKPERDQRLDRSTVIEIQGNVVDAVAEFHRLTGANILVAGEPLVERVDIHTRGSLRDALNVLGDQLDCRWAVGPAGMILMSKRFSRPFEYPQVNAEELRQTARDALRALRLLRCETGDQRVWGPMIKRFAQTLTSEQAATLERGEPLSSVQLNQAQRDALYSVVMTRAFGGIREAWETFSGRLDRLDKCKLVAHELPSNGGPGKQYVLEVRFGGLGIPALVLGQVNTGEGASQKKLPRSAVEYTDKALPARSPEPSDAGTKGMDARIAIKGAATLKALAGTIGSRTGTTPYVQPCLDAWRAIVFVNAVSGKSTVESLCGLGGWSAGSRRDGSIEITRQIVKLPKQPSGVGAYLRSVLPREVRDFVGLEGDSEQQGVFAPNGGAFGAKRTRVTEFALAALGRAFLDGKGFDHEIAYGDLSPRQGELVRLMLLLAAFKGADESLWRVQFGPHMVDTASASLELKQREVLLVKLQAGDHTFAFGANVRR